MAINPDNERFQCPDCKGKGYDQQLTDALRAKRKIGENDVMRCWRCYGHGVDHSRLPAARQRYVQ